MRYCCTQCGATNIRMKKRRNGKLGCAIMLLAWPLVLSCAYLFGPIVTGMLMELTPECMKGIWTGEMAMFVMYVLVMLFPYILYRLFAKTTIVCRKCKGENCLVPMNSPRGEEILNGGVAPKPVMKKKIIIKKRVVNLNRDR